MAQRAIVLPTQLDREGHVSWKPQDVRQLINYLTDLYGFVSLRPTEGFVRTTDATVTTLLTLPLEDHSTYQLVVDVVARRTGGSAGTAGDGASYRLIGTYRRVSAGDATLIGAITTVHSAESVGGWDCALSVSSQDVLVRCTGQSSVNVSWYAIATLHRV